jgi:lipoprotein-anchoring transpeptidase ErfK/SrfK
VPRVLFDAGGRRWWRRVATLLVSGALIAEPVGMSASAQSWFSPWGNSWDRGWDGRDRAFRERYRDGAPRHRRAKQAPRVADNASRSSRPAGPVTAIVSLNDQRIHVYAGENLLAQSIVSTGTRGYRTPTGVFSVIQKNRYHESNIYSGAPMPWMQRITWSGIALHGGVVPGYPASHGCIRLTYDFAPRMWEMTRVGARVIVSPHTVVPVAIVHSRLPVPALTPAANSVAGQERPTPIVVEAAAGEQRHGGADEPARRSDVIAAIPAPAQGADTPLQRARAAKAKATADSKAAEAALKSAVATARNTSAQARAAQIALRKAQGKVAQAERRLAAASRAVESASQLSIVERANDAETAARENLEAAREVLTQAAIAEALEARTALDAALAAKEALAKRDEAAESVKAWTRGLDPISIFVSRKEGRVFVRQGQAPLFDAVVTIRDAERSLGTHVFTALADEDGGARLRWAVVTVPDSEGGRTAAEALDRIEIPADFAKEIANRLWVGASLIISDQGISKETGLGTDFVVLTKP